MAPEPAWTPIDEPPPRQLSVLRGWRSAPGSRLWRHTLPSYPAGAKFVHRFAAVLAGARGIRDDGRMSSTPTITSYDEARATHRWEVPERYNIAADVCDKHPRDQLAMIHEDYLGNQRRVSWGELQDASNRLANVFAAHG